jgi:hypothetical protein
MAHFRIEFDRGNGWELRVEGDADADMDRLRKEARTYGRRHPARLLADGSHLIVTAPRGKLTKEHVAQCHAHAGDNGATIEFLK